MSKKTNSEETKITVGGIVTGLLIVVSYYTNNLTGTIGYGVKELRPWFLLIIILGVAMVSFLVFWYKSHKKNTYLVLVALLLVVIIFNFIEHQLGGY